MTVHALPVLDDDAPVIPDAPDDLQARGRRLWEFIAGENELDVHEEVVLHEACRVADHLDAISAECATSTVMVENFRGDPVASPAYVEHRQQAQALARLLASLRIPEGEGDSDRPQRRGTPRGYYGAAAARRMPA